MYPLILKFQSVEEMTWVEIILIPKSP